MNSEQKRSLLIGMQEDPIIRINKAKQMERQTKKIPKQEADISFKWMEQYELMHQGRMQLIETNRSLEAENTRKNARIASLESELEKSNSIVQELKSLVEEQRKIIYKCATKEKAIIFQQQQTIVKQQKAIRNLRVLNWRSKRLASRYKKTSKIIPEAVVRDMYVLLTKSAFSIAKYLTYFFYSVDEKPKYTKSDLDQAVLAVLAGMSLGKAKNQFNVPKETIRQAKMKAKLAVSKTD